MLDGQGFAWGWWLHLFLLLTSQDLTGLTPTQKYFAIRHHLEVGLSVEATIHVEKDRACLALLQISRFSESLTPTQKNLFAVRRLLEWPRLVLWSANERKLVAAMGMEIAVGTAKKGRRTIWKTVEMPYDEAYARVRLPGRKRSTRTS